MAAYRSGNLDEAIRHFQNVAQKISNRGGALYFGYTLEQMVKPGVDTSENLKIAQMAINAFQASLVLPLPSHSTSPSNLNSQTLEATKQIARINFSIGKLDESKVWQKKILDIEPKDADAPFGIGVIDVTEADIM